MSNWQMEIDNSTGKIITDEPTDDSCWEYSFSRDRGNGTQRGKGAICMTRETCIKKILKVYKEEVEEKQKELAKMKKNLRKIEDELNSD